MYPRDETPPAILETALYILRFGGGQGILWRQLGFEIITEAKNRHVFFRLDNSVLLLFNPQETINPPKDSQVGPHGATGSGPCLFQYRAKRL